MATVRPIYIRVDDAMGVDRSLKKFKRMCEAYGVIREYRKRKEYKKPSVRRTEKIESAEKRRKKAHAKMNRDSKV